jgi:hypothetical protein
MSQPLLPKRFLFRFAVPCFYRETLWTNQGAELDESCRLHSLYELEGQAGWADVRAAWNPSGLAFSVVVAGKSQAPWCRTSRAEESDNVQVWIDTRDIHTVHRAGRFCHRFLFMPTGDGSRLEKPVVQWMPIHRAREHPRAIPHGAIKARSETRPDGYRLDLLITADALTGFDPAEHPRLGFTYAATDRELGEQTLGVGSPMPYREDPSLWVTLELVR